MTAKCIALETNEKSGENQNRKKCQLSESGEWVCVGVFDYFFIFEIQFFLLKINPLNSYSNDLIMSFLHLYEFLPH